MEHVAQDDSKFSEREAPFSENQPEPPQIVQAEQLLGKLFMAAPSALSLSTRDEGRFVVVNEKFTTLTGYTQQEIVGRTAIELGLWCPAQLRDRIIDRLQKESFLQETEVSIRTRSGESISCACHMTPIEIDQIPCLLTQITDSTPQRCAQEALRDSETHYRTLVEEAFGSILRFDKAGRILYANAAAAALLDQPTNDLLGKTLRELGLMTELCVFWEERIARVFTERAPIEEEYLHCKTDLVATYAWRLMPEFDEYGNVATVLNTMYDISSHKQTDEERLHNSRLESLAVVAGGVAHDFNNILTAIMGHVSIARMMVKHQEKIDAVLAKSEEASLRARDLTMQLVTFSRGGTPIKATISIVDTIRNAAEQALRGDPRRSEFSIPPDLWPCEVDEGQFRSAIYNVVRSVQQAMPPGGTIYIKARNLPVTVSDSALSQVEISIHGGGMRITPENLEQIFDPYSSTTMNGGGLGLATAHTIIQNHDGYMRAESKPGREMTFRIFLPAIPGNTKKNVDFHGRLLILDDDKSTQELVKSILTETNVHVVLTDNDQDAINQFREDFTTGKPFDFVLLDLTVSGSRNTLDTLAQLRAIDPGVRALSSIRYTNDASGTRPTYPEFSGELTKPYSLHDLFEMLSRLSTS